MTTTEEAIVLIQQEIDWHERHNPPCKVSQEYRRGFLAGLKQARGVVVSGQMQDETSHKL